MLHGYYPNGSSGFEVTALRNGGNGITLTRYRRMTVNDCVSSANTGHGLNVVTSATMIRRYLSVEGCTFTNNTGDGINATLGASLSIATIINSVCSGNVGTGIAGNASAAGAVNTAKNVLNENAVGGATQTTGTLSSTTISATTGTPAGWRNIGEA